MSKKTKILIIVITSILLAGITTLVVGCSISKEFKDSVIEGSKLVFMVIVTWGIVFVLANSGLKLSGGK